MHELVSLFYILLIGSASGFIGSMVGSGGLISIPLLIMFGLPAPVAIATDRMGSFGLSLGAVPKYWKAKKIVWSQIPLFFGIALVGGLLGANIMLSFDQKLLSKLVGIIIVSVLPFILLKKDMGLHKLNKSKTKNILGYIVFFLVMIYAGFFGGGSGTLVIYTLIYFFGSIIVEATATSIVAWIPLSLLSTLIFAMNGVVNYKYGIILFVGVAIGSYIGAHTAIKKGSKWIRSVFGTVVLISCVKLLLF